MTVTPLHLCETWDVRGGGDEKGSDFGYIWKVELIGCVNGLYTKLINRNPITPCSDSRAQQEEEGLLFFPGRDSARDKPWTLLR